MLTKLNIEKYFTAEKQESLVFLGIGLAAIIIGILAFTVWKTPAWKGAAVPLITIALLQITVGYTVYNRSDSDRIRVVYQLDMNPNELRTKELPRMLTVMKNFVWYRWIEIALALIGIVLIVLYKNNSNASFWYGLGVALTIQAVLMLGADYFAEQRGKMYTQQLQSFVNK
jgi:drug/metabolite transporter (DMT)-like permease